MALLLLFAASCKKESIGYPQPILYMTFDESFAYVDEEISFKNLSEYSDTYEWDFGDGSTSIDANPAHAYDKAGEYTITLTGIGDGGEKKEKFVITIKEQTILGSWTLVNAVYEDSELATAAGSLEILDETNYTAEFINGANTGKVTAKFTTLDNSFLSNVDAKIAITNGKSMSGTPTQQLWATEIFCDKTVYNNYLKYGLGINKPEITISGRYMILSGSGGKAVFTYQKN